MSVTGIHGQIDVRQSHRRESNREFVDGAYWSSGVLSPLAISDLPMRRIEFTDCAIAITDFDIQQPADLIPLLEIGRDSGAKSLIVLAMRLSDRAHGLLNANNQRSAIQIVAVRTPGASASERAEAMMDLAILTGGQPIQRTKGQTATSIRPQDVGFARRVWADQFHVGVVGGQGSAHDVRSRIRSLRGSHERESRPHERQRLEERLGKFVGGSATLLVGGTSQMDTETRKLLAERTAKALKLALGHGIVPGGGVALLACRNVLMDNHDTTDPASRAAYGMLISALEQPFRDVLANAGWDANETLGKLSGLPAGTGMDVSSGRIVDMVDVGIVDSARVIEGIVQKTINSVALALTINTLVHPYPVAQVSGGAQ